MHPPLRTTLGRPRRSPGSAQGSGVERLLHPTRPLRSKIGSHQTPDLTTSSRVSPPVGPRRHLSSVRTRTDAAGTSSWLPVGDPSSGTSDGDSSTVSRYTQVRHTRARDTGQYRYRRPRRRLGHRRPSASDPAEWGGPPHKGLRESSTGVRNPVSGATRRDVPGTSDTPATQGWGGGLKTDVLGFGPLGRLRAEGREERGRCGRGLTGTDPGPKATDRSVSEGPPGHLTRPDAEGPFEVPCGARKRHVGGRVRVGVGSRDARSPTFGPVRDAPESLPSAQSETPRGPDVRVWARLSRTKRKRKIDP